MITRCLKILLLGLTFAAVLPGCGPSDSKNLIAKAQDLRQKNDYKAAIIELKNALQKDSSNAEARYLLGVTYYENGDFRLAEQELRRALELSYERSKVNPVLGKSMLMLGELQKVIDQIPVEAHASNIVQAEVLTLRARALQGLGRKGEARELLVAALSRQAEYADALVELARFSAGEQKFDETGSLLDRAIASAPKHVEAWLLKAELSRARGDQSGELAINNKVLEMDPQNVAARLNIAANYLVSNKQPEARKLILETRKLAPRSIPAAHLHALADYYAGDFNSANDLVQQVLKSLPDYLPSVMLASAIQLELGAYEQAQANLWRVLERMPTSLHARRLLVVALARSGQIPRALDALHSGLTQSPEDTGLLVLAGEMYLQNGEFAKAAQYFERVAKQDPKDAAARTKLGVSRMAAGDIDRAFADLESAVALDPGKYQADVVLVVSHLRQGRYEQALKAMEKLEAKQPKNPLTYNLKAVIYLEKKDFANARKNLERALELQPSFLAAALRLAQLDLQDRNPKNARRRLESILDKDKTNVQALLALADMGPTFDATESERVQWLERASKASSNSVPVQSRISRIYVQMGHPKKALEVAQQLQASNPTDPQVLDAVAAIQLSAGEREQAIATYTKLVGVQRNSPIALYKLASAQARGGSEDMAIATLKKALTIKPDYIEAQTALGTLELGAKRYAEAMQIARALQKSDSKSTAGFALEGDVLMAEKKYPEAIRVFESVHGMSKNASSLVKLHMAYVSAGRGKEGNALVVSWLKASPEDIVVRSYAADTSLQLGEYVEAIGHYEHLLRHQPTNWTWQNNLAWAYYYAKDKRALEAAETAYKLNPANATILDTLGWLHVEQGDAARGVKLLEKGSSLAPMAPIIRFHLAQGWLKVGEKAKARTELERVLASNQKFPQQAEAQSLLNKLRN